MTQGRSQARLSALVEVCHEDSSMLQVDFGHLQESLVDNDSPLKKPKEVNSARPATLMHANTLSNTGTERTLMSPAKLPS